MSNRPPIPVELKRKVLVEAGHRCAIHTCRHPTVDIHHIVPWDQCHEHSYNNLIALCPNCHRRATMGEIDRISLRIYKAQVSASSGISEHESGARQFSREDIVNLPGARWKTEKIFDSYSLFPPYEVELEFPRFNVEDEEIELLNILQRSHAIERMVEFRQHRLYSGPVQNNWQNSVNAISTLSESFEVSCFTPAIVSVRYSTLSYGAGAAHSNHYTHVANYQRKPIVPLRLMDVFTTESSFINYLSDFCVNKLTLEKKELKPSEWILEGAKPKMENYRNFNLTKDGMLLTFDEYQVGSYGEGAYHVFVPSKVLSAFLNPACQVTFLWNT
jgi:hypothetical protein